MIGRIWALTFLLALSTLTHSAEAPEQTSEATPTEATEPESTEKVDAPKDTLGGDGLKNRKLSEIFEQFVPTETISADNAVPFPVDI